MSTPNGAPDFTFCDNLQDLPPLARQNYAFETAWVAGAVPEGYSSLLQVGCMDGRRLLDIAAQKPMARMTGLDIEPKYVQLAQRHFALAGVADKLQAVVGDITSDDLKLPLANYDFVACLNNTLGYITDTHAALGAMRRLARRRAFVSVYGPQFTDARAREYFAATHMELSHIEGDTFHMQGGWSVRRYTHDEVYGWGGEVVATPMGYIAALGGLA